MSLLVHPSRAAPPVVAGGYKVEIGSYDGTGQARTINLRDNTLDPALVWIAPYNYFAWSYARTSSHTPGRCTAISIGNEYQDRITGQAAGSFSLFTNAAVNGVGYKYFYMCIGGDLGNTLAVGEYTGSHLTTDPQSIVTGFEPSIVMLFPEASSQDSYRVAAYSDTQYYLTSLGPQNNMTLDANGFTVTGDRSNLDGELIRYVAFTDHSAGSGIYSGNGTSQTINITPSSAWPEMLEVGRRTNARHRKQRFERLSGDAFGALESRNVVGSSGFVTDALLDQQTGEFSIGASGDVNWNGWQYVYYWLQGNVP